VLERQVPTQSCETKTTEILGWIS